MTITSLALAFSACQVNISLGGGAKSSSQNASKLASSTEVGIADSESTESESTESESTESESTDSTSKQDNAVDPQSYSINDPIPKNQEAFVTMYSTQDSTYRKVSVKITDIVNTGNDESKLKDILDEHNKYANDYSRLDYDDIMEKTPEDVEWCFVYYDLRIPETFTSNQVYSPWLDFSGVNIAGGGIPSTDGKNVYLGLASNMYKIYTDESNENTKFNRGDTYSLVSMYPMVKGFKDYVFELDYTPDSLDSISTNTDELLKTYFKSN